ncbi:MAG: hypothetical protein KKE62_04695 [Proteobacteria bacterium]|nr:hypothetical protein [Pseudomonadota bacterium]MBU1388061.1 hypothetical protein [Pseudomonadota bacterium]MBU1542124.1 hypothetical protein [Pseudomonadota bacterium]MBU2430061.1 hypothetical protein [Pseudomonadota bacterium]MBU2482388.1 hypothetical protein [Pseudomonadota bacterium]
MLNSIKKYFKKAQEEVSKDYSIHSSAFFPDQDLPVIGGEVLQRSKPWVGVDLDGTLAYWDSSSSIEQIGEAVPAMLALVKKMIHNNMRVKIFTARANDPEQLGLIREWLKANGLPELEITNVKDYYMQRLYDDRCIQVERNTGRLIADD